MRIVDVLPELTIQPLRRFADAWNVVSIKSDKRDVFEQAIISDVARINTEASASQRLATIERDLDYVRHGNAERLLRLLLDEPGYLVADDGALIERMVANDAAFFEYAANSSALRHLEPRTVEIYESVLQVAWEDKVSADEYRLIKRLQRKLGIAGRDHRVIEVRTVGSLPLTPQDAQQALRDLTAYPPWPGPWRPWEVFAAVFAGALVADFVAVLGAVPLAADVFAGLAAAFFAGDLAALPAGPPRFGQWTYGRLALRSGARTPLVKTCFDWHRGAASPAVVKGRIAILPRLG